jgi:hypothetical protein
MSTPHRHLTQAHLDCTSLHSSAGHTRASMGRISPASFLDTTASDQHRPCHNASHPALVASWCWGIRVGRSDRAESQQRRCGASRTKGEQDSSWLSGRLPSSPRVPIHEAAAHRLVVRHTLMASAGRLPRGLIFNTNAETWDESLEVVESHDSNLGSSFPRRTDSPRSYIVDALPWSAERSSEAT